jgi:DNA-binding NtrC family response regulator
MEIEKIVVVDDEMMNRKALETKLGNERYSVSSASDLKGARKILSRNSFGLIFRLTSAKRSKFYLIHYIKNRWSYVLIDEVLWVC